MAKRNAGHTTNSTDASGMTTTVSSVQSHHFVSTGSGVVRSGYIHTVSSSPQRTRKRYPRLVSLTATGPFTPSLWESLTLATHEVSVSGTTAISRTMTSTTGSTGCFPEGTGCSGQEVCTPGTDEQANGLEQDINKPYKI